MSNSNEIKAINQTIIADFRANGGKILRGQFAGFSLILLTTIGAKSGKPRTSPLVYTNDGDRVIILASLGGAPTNPDWYHNLLADPLVTIEIGNTTYQAQASIAEGAERERLFAQVVAKLPYFGEYQRKTTRLIPVVILTAIDAAPSR